MNGIAREIEYRRRDYFVEEKQENGMIEVRFQMRPEQIVILKSILYESDFMDVEQIKDKVYSFGRTVKAKDLFGRDLFVFMATLIRGAELRNRRGNRFYKDDGFNPFS